jgi:hypothetical protein
MTAYDLIVYGTWVFLLTLPWTIHKLPGKNK